LEDEEIKNEYNLIDWDGHVYGFKATKVKTETSASIEILDRNTHNNYKIDIQEGKIDFGDYNEDLENMPDAEAYIDKLNEDEFGEHNIVELNFDEPGTCMY
jgi:hypothetical protein